ncbi:hypothetical protein [Sphingomonas daechungensis]|uniref:hypothetical protein n=1 Tax=Sphingomonas daechungensis TaxID=1176646 RepID=UPI0037838FEB
MQVLNTLWVGDQLGKLEQLCVLSGLAAGHPYHVYSYEPDKLRGVPDGAEVRDAAEVMPRHRLLAYAECNSYALGANFWRYEMLRQGRGYWVDLDVLVLRPFDLDQPYVFGTEEQGTVNNAVMLAPPDSPLVEDLVSLPERIGCPPWYGPRRSAQYFLRRLKEGRLRLQDYPWGTFGPGMLGYLVGKHRLSEFAAAPEVFYPLSWRDVTKLYGPAEEVDALLTPETRGIHLYNSQLRELAKSRPPAGSYMARQFDRFGLN